MAEKITCISPVDGRVYASRPVASKKDIAGTFSDARTVQEKWKRVPLAERAAYCSAAVDAMVAMKDEIVPELAWQMGRPVRYGAGEVRGFEERARYMIGIAGGARRHVSRPRTASCAMSGATRSAWSSRSRRELPPIHCRQLDHPGADGGNTVAEACGLDAAGGGAVPGSIDRAKLPKGVFQHLVPSHPQTAEIIAGGHANMVLHGIGGGGRPWRRRRALHQRGARRQGPGLRGPTPHGPRHREPGRRRVLPGRIAAPSSASTTSRCGAISSMVSSTHEEVRASRRSTRRRRSPMVRPEATFVRSRSRGRGPAPRATSTPGPSRWTRRAHPTWPRRSSLASRTG